MSWQIALGVRRRWPGRMRARAHTHTRPKASKAAEALRWRADQKLGAQPFQREDDEIKNSKSNQDSSRLSGGEERRGEERRGEESLFVCLFAVQVASGYRR